jgi:hypothetical protein
MTTKYSPDNVVRRKLTPPQVAEIFGINPDKVLSWIRAGRLRAVNIGNGNLRPRYVIDPDDIETFEQANEAVPVADTPPPRRRRRPTTSIKEFF